MTNDVMVFTPVYRLEEETIRALFALEWDGPLTWVFQRDNPHPGTDRATGVKNHLHQYQRGRETFLAGRYDAMLVVESDIIPPADALKRLAALDCDVAYGVYVFRKSPVVNVFERYYWNMPTKVRKAANIGESFSVRGLWPPPQDVMPCSGAGLGCTLIKRHVLEAVEFRTLRNSGAVHCDSWFTNDVYDAGYQMMTDTRVLCGHKTEEGEVLWPPRS